MELVGALATGIVVGWIVYFCLVKFAAVDVNTLLKVLGAIFGGVVVAFLINGLKATADVYAVYAIGVLVGMVLFFIMRALGIGPTIANPS